MNDFSYILGVTNLSDEEIIARRAVAYEKYVTLRNYEAKMTGNANESTALVIMLNVVSAYDEDIKRRVESKKELPNVVF